jgi:hypothetical protein
MVASQLERVGHRGALADAELVQVVVGHRATMPCKPMPLCRLNLLLVSRGAVTVTSIPNCELVAACIDSASTILSAVRQVDLDPLAAEHDGAADGYPA